MNTRRYVLLAGAALAAALAALAFALASPGSSPATSTAVPSSLPGELTGPVPWGRNANRLRARLVALRLPALGFEGTAVHIHQHLDVYVAGRHVVVSAGIGIDPAGRFISPLHTHDTSGVIHVESPTVRPFTLGEFFGVWGVRLGAGELGGYKAGGGRALHAYVDGKEVTGDPGKIELAPHQEIVLAFGTSKQLRRPLPSSYAFPAGL
jgi:hypothetical protein